MTGSFGGEARQTQNRARRGLPGPPPLGTRTLPTALAILIKPLGGGSRTRERPGLRSFSCDD